MYVRDAQGNWYEVADASLKGKAIPSEKAVELQAAERAEARKRAAELLAAQDEGTIVAIRESLGIRGLERPPVAVSDAPGLSPVGVNDCWDNDCHTNDCHTNDCHGNDCHSEYGGVNVVNPRDWYTNPRQLRGGRVAFPSPQLGRRRRG